MYLTHSSYSAERSPCGVQASAEAEATRAAILEELRMANEYELDAAARKAEAEAKRASALHKLLRDEQLAAERDALPAAVSAWQPLHCCEQILLSSLPKPCDGGNRRSS